MTTVASAPSREPGGNRRLLTEVPRQIDHHEAPIAGVMIEHDLQRAVRAAIVDVDDLRVDVPQPVEHRPHAREQLLETRALVVDRDDDGQRGRVGTG